MNKKILILIAFLALTANFYGQRRPDRDKLKALKIAYFTEKLDLSSSEAQAFWPVYNKHEAQMNSFRKAERSEFRGKLKNINELSEKEAEKLLQKHIDLQKKKQNERQSFIEKMKGILSAKKTMLLLKTEEDFKKQLIKQYRQRRLSGGGYR